MRLLPYVLVGVLWVLAYIAAGWQAIAVMAVLGVVGEALLFGADALAERRDRRRAVRRWPEMH